MTTPARQDEADRVEQVYHWALVQLGAASIEEALELWEDVPASERAATSARWLSEAVETVMLYRGMARDLALAYYRLVRALRTGSTVADPRKPEPEHVSLEMLRDEFEALVDEIDAPAAQNGGTEPLTDTSEGEDTQDDENVPQTAPSYEDDEYDEDDQILLEEIAELEAEVERQDREAEEEAALLLDQLGIENMLRKLEEIDQEQGALEVDRQREEAHRKAGSRQAAVAERITLNAARGLTYNLAEFDGRVIGWARYSTTGTPCGWCAMLISRGAVYKSAKSAAIATNDDGNRVADQFHDNCHCIAIPVFTRDQFGRSELFALNREYADLWPKVTAGKGGDAAISAWRKYIRQLQREARAQAAASQ